MEVPEAARRWVRHGDFYADPVKNPLHTATGKIGLYVEAFERFGTKECPPIPKYLEPAEFLGNAKPGQVHVVSPHPFMRVHSQMANAECSKHLNIQGREFALVSEEDARERGVKDGDLIEVYNDRGAVIVGARVSPNIMKGVISIYEGAWLSKDSKGRCNSGAINVLTTSVAASDLSQATSANTCLASFRKCTDAEGPNRAYEPPVVENSTARIEAAALSLTERAQKAKAASTAGLTPGEKLFYERCTLCHVPREPGDYTVKQWHGITESMFPRAGLTDDERKLVLEFLEKNAKK
nr:molybdopterin dinucleotide binding domain-containing protein [Thauera propionica]